MRKVVLDKFRLNCRVKASAFATLKEICDLCRIQYNSPPQVTHDVLEKKMTSIYLTSGQGMKLGELIEKLKLAHNDTPRSWKWFENACLTIAATNSIRS